MIIMNSSQMHFDSSEQKSSLDDFNNTQVDFPLHKLLHQFVEEQCAKTPDADAVCFKGTCISYQELNSRANQLAHYLRSQHVQRDTLVAISMERSIELVIGLLAILKAGGAYVAMDPSYPADRLAYIFNDSRAKILLTQTKNINLLKVQAAQVINMDDLANFNDYSKDNPLNINQPDDLSYVIYTSGSTGKPKGVGNIHKGVVNRILWMQNEYQLTTNDRILQKTPFGFDVSVWEFFWPLMTGAVLVMAEPNIHKDTIELAELIKRENITTLHFVPSMLNVFLESDVAKKCSSIRQVFVSGEALSKATQNQFFKQFKNARLHNLYGPTEAAIDVTFWECVATDTNLTVPIGRPIANTQIYILDELLKPVAKGIMGQIAIGGVGLARGYMYKDELTQEKFITNSFLNGQRLYLTGDLGLILSNDVIEYKGRIDNQLKLRGFRVELGEIEARLKDNLKIRNAVVIAREDIAEQKYLAAYLISDKEISSEEKLTLKSELFKELKKFLPEYMVPTTVTFINEFPVNDNGKLDIKRLPKPTNEDYWQINEYIAPQNSLELSIQLIWEQILNRKNISATSSFFSEGGNSLLAMQLISKIKSILGKDIKLSEMMNYSTIQEQAQLITNRQTVEEKKPELVHDKACEYEPFPLNDIQRAYFLGRTNAFDLGNIRSHIYVENEKESLDINKLEQALNKLIARHNMLHSIILENGSQQIIKDPPYYKIEISNDNLLDVRNSIKEKFSHQGISPLFEVRVTQQKNKMIIHFYFDLLIVDGTSIETFFEELFELYEHPEHELRPLDISYRDIIINEQKTHDSFIAAQSYWYNRIDSLPPTPELPTKTLQSDKTPPFVRRQGRLSPAAWNNFKEIAKEFNVTPATLLITIYGEVLKNWSKSPHFTLNVMYFNRSEIQCQELQKIIGNFSTTFLLEMNLAGNHSLLEKAKIIQQQLLNDLEHGEFNGIKVLNELNRRRGGASIAAMPVVFACALDLKSSNKKMTKNLFKWYGSGVSYSELETPQVWLDHQVYEDEDGSFLFCWDVRDGYFPDGMVDDMYAAYQTILNAVANNLNHEFSLLPAKDTSMIQQVNSTEVKIEPTCLHVDVFEQAKKTPKKIAIQTSNVNLSYQELIATAITTTNHLDQNQLQPGDFVAIVMEKGWEQIAAILAIHAAGAAYIPIDARLPANRIKQILDISGCKAILAQKSLDFPCDLPVHIISQVITDIPEIKGSICRQKPNDLAYVIFTSGSTGVPKGVMIEHQAALNTIEAINLNYGITASDRVFAISSLSFDLSVFDVFGMLRIGASLYVPTSDEEKNPEQWLRCLKENKITIWNSVPALMQLTMDRIEIEAIEPDKLSNLRLVMMSGDWIPVNLPRRISRFSNAKIYSLGGATEASIWSNHYPITDVDPTWTNIPYGKALANQTMYVLDDRLEPKPFWVTGMIYIGGKGLARGYLGDPEKTANSFLIHSKTGLRLYKTNDLGRLCPDGNIEFLGREDLQVKVQGYRIELEEIESIIRQTGLVNEVIVRIQGNKSEAKKIVAFFIANNPVPTQKIISLIENKLPTYMIPNRFVQIDSFPLNSNGKVDVKTLLLPLSEAGASNMASEHVEPKSVLEKGMAKIWEELLKIKPVGLRNNFFHLGGNSFLAFQMIHQVKVKLGLTLSISALFRKGTIEELLEDKSFDFNKSLILLNKGKNAANLFFVHPSGGGVFCYAELAHYLEKEYNLYGIQSPGYVDERPLLTSIDDMAEYNLNLIKMTQPTGPYRLGGWSLGGVVAYATAIKLKKEGFEVEPVIMIDSPAPIVHSILSDADIERFFKEDNSNYFHETNEDNKVKDSLLFKIFRNNVLALRQYQPLKSDVDIIQFKANDVLIEQLSSHPRNKNDDWGWSELTSGKIKCYLFNTDHAKIVMQPHIQSIGQIILNHRLIHDKKNVSISVSASKLGFYASEMKKIDDSKEIADCMTHGHHFS